MALIKRDVWKCEVCGWEWVARNVEVPPETCASQKCRSRKWNTLIVTRGVEMPPPETLKVGQVYEPARVVSRIESKPWVNPLSKLNDSRYKK